MKHLFFILLPLLLISCAEEYTVTVDNQSSQTAAFTFTTGYATKEYTLEPSTKYNHSLPKTLGHKMENYGPGDLIELSQSGDVYYFSDMPPILIPSSIFNSLSKSVILSADGAISTDPLTIGAGQEINTEFIIRHDPSFSAITIDGFPVQVDFTFDDTEYKIILR